MGFSAENDTLQRAYHRLRLTALEKSKVLEKLDAAEISRPTEDRLIAFFDIYAAIHTQFMRAYAECTVDNLAFLTSELAKLGRLEQDMLRKIADEKRRAEQAVFEQVEYLRVLKLHAADLENYQRMLDKLEEDYLAWREKQEQARIEREKLLRIIDQALKELFDELLQSKNTHEFYFAGEFLISIAHADVYRQIESSMRHYFHLGLHQDDYEAIRQTKVEEIVGNQIDTQIQNRPHAEHAHLLALKHVVVKSEARKIIKAIDAEMQQKASYHVADEAYRKLYAEYGDTVVKQSVHEVAKEKEVVSEEREVVSEAKEEVSEARAAASKDKAAAVEAMLEANQQQEDLSKVEQHTKAKEEVISTLQVAEKETLIETEGSEEKKIINKSSEAQILQAFFDAQSSKEETSLHASKLHSSKMSEILRAHQSTETQTQSSAASHRQTIPSTLLPQSALATTPPTSQGKVAKNDAQLQEGQPAASTPTPVRKRRF